MPFDSVEPRDPPVKIAMDLSGLLHPGTGAETYTRELVLSMVREISPPTDRIVGFVNRFAGTPRFPALENVPFVNPRWPWRVLRPLWDLGSWNVDRFTGPIDVFHAGDWTCPPLRQGLLVATVFDLAFHRHPECYPPELLAIHRSQLEQVRRRAQGVVAISASTKRDLEQCWGRDGPEVRVIYPAGDPIYAEPREPEAELSVRSRLGLPVHYFLYMGTQSPRKNVPRLVRAYARARQLGLESALVLAGSSGRIEGKPLHGSTSWDGPRIAREIAVHGLEGSVLPVGHLLRGEAAHVMRGARAFVFPSLYEGFGLPVLEALSAGIPVIASGVTSLPEVGGEAVKYVDPESEESIAQAMLEIDSSGDRREELSRLGQARARSFSWAGAARETLRFYRDLLERR